MTRGLSGSLLLLLALVLAPFAWAEVTATVDRNVVSQSETFELRLRVDGAMNAEEPELSALQQDFEILSTSRNHRISLMQGQRESYTEWAIVLLARRSGDLQIPSIRVGEESSAPIRIAVREGRAQGSTPSGDVSLEVETESEAVHVQQQLLVTVRLRHAVNLSSGATLEELDIPGAVVRKLDEGSHEDIIGGRRFGVFERRYAVFPQKSGELTVPALRFSGSTGADSWFDRFDTGERQYRLQSDARTIRVLPPEQGVTPWIPARNLSVVEKWDRDPDALRAGESATRSITVTAEGLTGAQIPPIPDPDIAGVRFYADKPEVSDAASASGVSGTRVQRMAVIPKSAGELVFPELRVRWWDTVHGRFEEAVVPARTLRVMPGADPGLTPSPSPRTVPAPDQGARNATPAPPPTSSETGHQGLPGSPGTALPWMISTGLSALLAAFFAVQWWRLRGGRQLPPVSAVTTADAESGAFERLEGACRAGDSVSAASALLEWAKAAFPGAPIHSASALWRVTGNTDLRAAVDVMMASRYGTAAGRWDGAMLVSLVAQCRGEQRRRADRSSALPPLYGAA